MSEYAQRRDAREVWVSRSHLHAALAAAMLLSVACFGGGYLVGRLQTSAHADAPVQVLAGDVPGRELLAVLAEVERNAVTSASAAMIYPDLLQKNGAPQVPTEAPSAVGVRAEIPAPVAASFEPDPLPPGAWTVRVGAFRELGVARDVRAAMREQGHAAWWRMARVDGALNVEVSVGGFASEEEAEAALARVAASLATAVQPGLTANVVPMSGP
jgi:cell division septation protein DedD